jgi:hypothetical protein
MIRWVCFKRWLHIDTTSQKSESLDNFLNLPRNPVERVVQISALVLHDMNKQSPFQLPFKVSYMHTLAPNEHCSNHKIPTFKPRCMPMLRRMLKHTSRCMLHSVSKKYHEFLIFCPHISYIHTDGFTLVLKAGINALRSDMQKIGEGGTGHVSTNFQGGLGQRWVYTTN